MKKILLVNYEFPPNNDIGGRRWAKLSKYLAKSDYEIHVINTTFHTATVSSWEKDVLSPNIVRHPLPLKYPKVFISHNGGIINKIRFKLLILYYSITTKKRIYDRTFLWEKQFIKKAEELIIENRIENVIVTGAPFYIMTYAAKLKSKFPTINLIADYRDPWIGAKNFGLGNLDASHLRYEMDMQNEVAKNFNYILAPNKFLLNTIKESIDVPNSCLFEELTHAYDQDDFKISNLENRKQDVIRFVYGGAIYMGLDKFLNHLSATLSKLKVANIDLYNKLRFDFYTPDKDALKMFNIHSSIVTTNLPIGESIFQEIEKADFCMIMLADQNKNYLTTKSIEFMTQRKPFFYLGQNGFVAQFIEENKLGVSIKEEENFLGQLERILQDYGSGKLEFNNTFNVSNYSFETVVEGLKKIIK